MALQLRILRPEGSTILALGAVTSVTERRVTMTTSEVDESLRNGALRTTDLVELGGRWLPLAEAIPFIEPAEVAHRRERRRAFRVAAGQALIATLLAVLTIKVFLFVSERSWCSRCRELAAQHQTHLR